MTPSQSPYLRFVESSRDFYVIQKALLAMVNDRDHVLSAAAAELFNRRAQRVLSSLSDSEQVVLIDRHQSPDADAIVIEALRLKPLDRGAA